MGRVKSAMLRKAAKELVATEEGFSDNFENNKRLLKGTIPYKSVRNKVAGAIVTMKKRESKKE